MSVDETWSDRRDYFQKYGYSFRGESAVCTRLLVRGQRISAIAAISTTGLIDHTVDL